ncbi:hypothetical protein [Anoxybacteroides tepidamans]|uniref:hypothetical protein n=1 Tax=Anoxybacteroides tepidamans TaxID=265948 RepID=UPI0006876A56|nr:hypothetical protein [Anoxybacillus tepidamans]
MFLLVLCLSACSQDQATGKNSAKSWVSDKLIIWNHITYIATNEKVEKVGEKIGMIQHYSTKEQESTPDHFSNYYKEGTPLYKIPNVAVEDAIAVKIKENEYIKANSQK